MQNSETISPLSGFHHALSGKDAAIKPQATILEYIPVKALIGKYFTRTSFYTYVNSVLLDIYKVGRLSFVKAEQLHPLFITH